MLFNGAIRLLDLSIQQNYTSVGCRGYPNHKYFKLQLKGEYWEDVAQNECDWQEAVQKNGTVTNGDEMVGRV